MEIKVSLDQLTLGDLERIESGKLSVILSVLEHLVTIPGVAVEDIPSTLRALHYSKLDEITAAIKNALDTSVDTKN